jgi:toxin YoeB
VKIIFVSTGWRDYLYWQNTDRAILKKIDRLIDDITRDPFTGVGKPEPLRYSLAGAWSRRITDEHRLVYVIGVDTDGKETVTIIGCRHHYDS